MEKDNIRYHNGQELYPVQVDSATWLLVPKEKANRETAEKFIEKMTESRKLATKRAISSDVQMRIYKAYGVF